MIKKYQEFMIFIHNHFKTLDQNERSGPSLKMVHSEILNRLFK